MIEEKDFYDMTWAYLEKVHTLEILDEQYSGSTPAQTTGAAQPSPTDILSETQQASFLSAAGTLIVMLVVWMWKRKGTY